MAEKLRRRCALTCSEIEHLIFPTIERISTMSTDISTNFTRKTFDDSYGRHALVHILNTRAPEEGRVDVRDIVGGRIFHLTRLADDYEPTHAAPETVAEPVVESAVVSA